MNKTTICHCLVAKCEADAHQQIDQVAQHNDSGPAQTIAEFTYQRCGNDERDIEQGVKQHDVIDCKTDAVCAQQQKSETEIGQ